MHTVAEGLHRSPPYPVEVRASPALRDRNRLTTAFRLILALPHLILVGGPIALGLSWAGGSDTNGSEGLGAGGGLLGAVAAMVAVIAWFAILFTGRYPRGLWDLAAYYLRWRVRAIAYTALLRDEYPPFGDGPYPVTLELSPPDAPRDRLTVAFRILLAIPHIFIVCALGIAWGFSTFIAWFAILFTGGYPEGLYRFGMGVFRWNVRLESYLLLLRDEYPPFAFD